MTFEDAEKIVDKAKTQPKKTIVIVVVALVLIAITAYVTGFFTKKGTQHATPTTPAQTDQSEPNATPNKKASSEKSRGPTSMVQKTTGDQSPAVSTEGGDAIIIYDDNKGSQ